MRYTVEDIAKKAKAWTAGLAVAAAASGLGMASAGADEVTAQHLLKAMSDYLAAQKTISLDYDSNLEIVTTEKQKIGLASSGSLTLKRPDQVRATRRGGFADVELVFDGKLLTLIGKNANVYAQLEVPGSIDHLVDELREKYHRPMPAADLIMADPYGELMPLAIESKDLGSGVIRGVECDHLAFRTKEVDWQIWIAQGDRPYPCRYVVTSTAVAGDPQYTIDVRTWKTGAEVASASFSADIPAGAKKLNPGDLDFDDVPAIFTRKGGQ